MARRYDSKEAKRRILTACVRLFLEKGYTNTKVAEILKEADVSAGSFQNIFRTKDGVLTELISMMFSRQFGAVRPLAANAPSPVYLYAVETALQLHIAELNPALRELYVTAYSLPSTSEFIYRSMTEKLPFLFGSYMPQASAQDFYELEIASAGITRGYMAKACGPNFPMEQKLRRYLGCCFTLYGVPEDRQQSVIQTVLTMKLEDTARKLIDDTIRRADAGLE